MATSNAEDYLKAIHQLCEEEQVDNASTGDLARQLGLTPGSVTGMLQRLQKAGLVDYAPHQGAQLTSKGKQAALRVVRRHRLLELFLVRSLGMSWDEVHEEAELLEHSASDRLIDRIDVHLGYPDRDPHGDPIPDAKGNMPAIDAVPLANCRVGAVFEVRQVDDSSRELLRYLSEGGVGLGTRGKVTRNEPDAGIVEIEVDSRRIALGRQAALRILVRRFD
ncbi:MAG: metal-dependent transcriptional regulator [Planctomycetota bacterium]